ncbi:MAG TPA: isopentenyl-diphosphate Delta-isomerase [Gammaproteobacteria bacterium]|nr:isopentenyl-diphosphate Delta-isomerase [Gammaproteobacteria bacterium]
MPATTDIRKQVILVNEQDTAIGSAEKLAAHQQGLLHRAFSIFIFRKRPGKESELLLQQRASTKYHSAGLWTNTCCSHPAPGENLIQAAIRRLKEEFNLDIPELVQVGHFHYIAHFDNGLIENELDHVLVGWYHKQLFTPNLNEIQAYRWIGRSELQAELRHRPEQFTPWLKQAFALTEALITKQS